jgi:SAM-dependent methyltransferase
MTARRNFKERSTEVFEDAHCDLCGSERQTVLLRKRDTTSYWRAKCAEDGIDPETPFPIVRCGDCGHVYVSPRLRHHIVGDIYSRFWKKYQPTEIKADPFALYLCRQLRAMVGAGHLLDFGCGWGNYLAAARAVGFDAVGIEVDQAKVDFALKYGLNAVQGDLLDRTFADNSFDAAVAQQVFEHLYDPVPHLEELRRILKPGGVLFLSVPNYGGLTAKLKGADWDMMSPVGHVRYFNRRGLAKFLTDHGFAVERKRYIKRFERGFVNNLVYRAIVLLENELNFYPHNLALYARKL